MPQAALIPRERSALTGEPPLTRLSADRLMRSSAWRDVHPDYVESFGPDSIDAQPYPIEAFVAETAIDV